MKIQNTISIKIQNLKCQWFVRDMKKTNESSKGIVVILSRTHSLKNNI